MEKCLKTDDIDIKMHVCISASCLSQFNLCMKTDGADEVDEVGGAGEVDGKNRHFQNTYIYSNKR